MALYIQEQVFTYSICRVRHLTAGHDNNFIHRIVLSHCKLTFIHSFSIFFIIRLEECDTNSPWCDLIESYSHNKFTLCNTSHELHLSVQPSSKFLHINFTLTGLTKNLCKVYLFYNISINEKHIFKETESLNSIEKAIDFLKSASEQESLLQKIQTLLLYGKTQPAVFSHRLFINVYRNEFDLTTAIVSLKG